MADYFDFNYIDDPPVDELVDEESLLNENWEKADIGLHLLQQEEVDPVDPPVGLDVFRKLDGDVHRAVWIGGSYRFASSIPLGWGSWIELGLESPVVARPGWTPKARVNERIRQVQLTGGVRADSSSSAWPSSSVQLTDDDTAINDSFGPVGGKSIQQSACGAIGTDGELATARITIEVVSSLVRIYAQWYGESGGGNFICLDGIKWWY